MANVDIQLGYKDSTWFTNNATLVLLAGQMVYLQQTGSYKIGDGTTQLSALSFLGTTSDLVIATVVNKTNTNLLASQYKAVKVSTAQGQRLAVDFAQANNDNNSADTIGLVRENILNNQEGDITILGQVTGINTTGSLQSETWTDGDVLYLSPTTAGAITNIKPTGLTGHLVIIGYVEYAHANNGKIYTKISNGYELDELHNIYINPSTLTDTDILRYDSADSLWKNSQESTKVIYKDFSTSSALTGTTAATIIKSCLITANTVTTNDEIIILSRALRNTATGTATQTLYYNTTASLTGATLIGTQSSTSGFYSMQRNLFVKSATNSETLLSSISLSPSDPGVQASTTMSNLNIDWANNVYILQVFQNAAVGDSTTSRGITIKRFR